MSDAPHTGVRFRGVIDLDEHKVYDRPTIYVYEAPVRAWHWVNALAITVLALTGYFIGSPPPALTGDASDHFLIGYIRFAHFAAGYILAVGFLARIYWGFIGNSHSRQIFYLPVWDKAWRAGVVHEALWYLFLRKAPKKYVGHNPLAQTAMFLMFTLFTLFMIVTGFALYSEGAGIDSWQAKLFGWVFDLFPNSMTVHTLHHLGMWVIIVFAMLHIYAAIREDIMSRQTMISTMISGERQFRDDREE
ncbi:MAG: Ni/Fe-hydrogenase, b-type cytochrome subunit [Ancalomicrobiaceae bacterium]|nr:Ni/Fe-hydrogenase, b-type cytochrome subunit [Ancalomicrobiaceae bacterium]